MIKINLNLLPPRKKEKLNSLIKFIFSKHILEIILFMISLMAIILIWSWIILQDGFIKLSAASMLVNKEYAGYNVDIKKLNVLIDNIDKTTSEHENIIPKIEDFSKNLPVNIRINSFHLDKKTYILSIQGTAKTRQALLDYQSKLKDLSWAQGFSTPVSKLFQQENISFEFKTQLSNIKKVK